MSNSVRVTVTCTATLLLCDCARHFHTIVSLCATMHWPGGRRDLKVLKPIERVAVTNQLVQLYLLLHENAAERGSHEVLQCDK
jgi:hypothetical protein